ncbi:Antitoxin VapB32 [Tepidimonas sediminis]|uniref:Antitoxin VapB32 n=1 Tax=Tepidimonas sediminis TaxID=2588941 RepID=A0A554WFW4_9BURK|nr:type II toxin-antitoxin system VapB family antitoxin [Tepidimonas sediminis]TSE22468.1 Antitoxin VapB32 [Tepidimonas sediminis]
MRATITVDDALVRQALSLADREMDQTELFREAIQTFIRVQAGKRLAAQGGQAPDMSDIPRRRAAVRPADRHDG